MILDLQESDDAIIASLRQDSTSDAVTLQNGSISLAVAMEINRIDTLDSIALRDCYPADQPSSEELSRTFSSGLDLISIQEFPCNFANIPERVERMLRTVLRQQTTVAQLDLSSVTFREESMAILRSFLRTNQSIDHLIFYDCTFRGSCSLPHLLASMPRKPRKLELFEMNLENIGELETPEGHRWSGLEVLKINEAVCCLPNLVDLTDLKSLEIQDYDTGEIALEACSHLVRLLDSRNCSLVLLDVNIENMDKVRIMAAAQNCKSLHFAKLFGNWVPDPYLFRNWAGTNISDPPLGLWPRMLVRIHPESARDTHKTKLGYLGRGHSFPNMCADARYHLLRNGDIASMFGSSIDTKLK